MLNMEIARKLFYDVGLGTIEEVICKESVYEKNITIKERLEVRKTA